MDAPMHTAPRLATIPLLLFLFAACDAPSSGDADEETTDEAEAPCEPGSELCECDANELCDEGLMCVVSDEGSVCIPEPECPVGSEGCPCTEGGGCDDGFVCNAAYVCEPDPDMPGAPCSEEDPCGLGLDCVEGECQWPSLPSGPHAGWGDVRCFGPGADPVVCHAPRGDAWESVYPACLFAAGLADGTIARVDEWTIGCMEGEPLPGPHSIWDDVMCQAASGDCFARRGDLWVQVYPDCADELPSADLEPWPENPDFYGCAGGQLGESDVEEWRCPSDSICAARRGSLWTYPRPECALGIGHEEFSSGVWPPDVHAACME